MLNKNTDRRLVALEQTFKPPEDDEWLKWLDNPELEELIRMCERTQELHTIAMARQRDGEAQRNTYP